MENGVKHVLPDQRYFQRNAPCQQKKNRKMIEKTFLIISPLLLHKINKNIALLKGK
jgi:hypothetical protein